MVRNLTSIQRKPQKNAGGHESRVSGRASQPDIRCASDVSWTHSAVDRRGHGERPSRQQKDEADGGLHHIAVGFLKRYIDSVARSELSSELSTVSLMSSLNQRLSIATIFIFFHCRQFYNFTCWRMNYYQNPGSFKMRRLARLCRFFSRGSDVACGEHFAGLEVLAFQVDTSVHLPLCGLMLLSKIGPGITSMISKTLRCKWVVDSVSGQS